MIKLINLPSPFLFVDKEQIPLGLLYLGAVLKKEGCDVELIDLAGKDDWAKSLEIDKSDLVGLSVTTPQFNTAKKIREIYPDVPIIAGGPQPSIVPDLYLKNGFTGVCIGEGEKAIIKMAKNPKGIYQEPLIQNLDEIPFPAWDLIDIKSYRQTFMGKKIYN